jgi:hypothetical protein
MIKVPFYIDGISSIFKMKMDFDLLRHDVWVEGMPPVNPVHLIGLLPVAVNNNVYWERMVPQSTGGGEIDNGSGC